MLAQRPPVRSLLPVLRQNASEGHGKNCAQLYDILEWFPADVNRGGFPRVQFSDSGFMLMKEVGMDGSRAFTGSS